jgi:hypothetical protein
MRQQHREYHSERARAELEQAERATLAEAAHAHRRLSFLHMKMLQRNDEECDGSAVWRPR